MHQGLARSNPTLHPLIPHYARASHPIPTLVDCHSFTRFPQTHRQRPTPAPHPGQTTQLTFDRPCLQTPPTRTGGPQPRGGRPPRVCAAAEALRHAASLSAETRQCPLLEPLITRSFSPSTVNDVCAVLSILASSHTDQRHYRHMPMGISALRQELLPRPCNVRARLV